VNPADAPLIAGLLALFGAAVFLAASEASLLRVSRVKVSIEAERGSAAANRLLKLVDELPHVMNTVLLAVLLTQIATASMTSVLAGRWFGSAGVTAATFGLTLFLFVYAEAIPKTVAVRQPLRVAMALSGPVSLLVLVLRPFVAVLVAFADLQAPGEGIASSAVSEEELIRMAEEAASDGTIDADDAQLVHRSFEFNDTSVREVLVPRVDVCAVGVDESVHSALEAALAEGHRRVAVHEGSLDQLVGVVRLRDLAAAVASESKATAGQLMRPPLVVPEGMKIVELLREMQRTGQHFAVAVDEHGGTEGIVTIEDIVEELVGEISSDMPATPAIQPCSDGVWLVDATTDADELADLLDLTLPEGDFRSVGGLVMHLMGRLPELDAEIALPGYRLRVVARGRQRIHRVEITRTA
jgi:putative hemolysin